MAKSRADLANNAELLNQPLVYTCNRPVLRVDFGSRCKNTGS
jgi:hypothetical protein